MPARLQKSTPFATTKRFESWRPSVRILRSGWRARLGRRIWIASSATSEWQRSWASSRDGAPEVWPPRQRFRFRQAWFSRLRALRITSWERTSSLSPQVEAAVHRDRRTCGSIRASPRRLVSASDAILGLAFGVYRRDFCPDRGRIRVNSRFLVVETTQFSFWYRANSLMVFNVR
jgi:hypothetical protein